MADSGAFSELDRNLVQLGFECSLLRRAALFVYQIFFAAYRKFPQPLTAVVLKTPIKLRAQSLHKENQLLRGVQT